MIKWQKGKRQLLQTHIAIYPEKAFPRLFHIVKLIPGLRLFQDIAGIYVPEFIV